LRWHIRGIGGQNIAMIPDGATGATRSLEIARTLAGQVRACGLTAKEIRGLRRGGLPLPSEPPVTPAGWRPRLDEFEIWAAQRAAAKHAHRNRRIVQAYVAAAGIARPEQITVASVRGYMDAVAAAGPKKAASTIHKVRGGISRYCRFLIERGELGHNVARDVEAPAITLPAPKYLPAEQLEQVLQLAEAAGIGAEVATAAYTGMRVGEIAQLDWAEIHWPQQQIVLTATKTKTGRPRAIPLAAKLADRLREYAGGAPAPPTAGPVFPKRGERAWQALLKPCKTAAAFQAVAGTGCGAGWHLLRHTFASLLVQRGVGLEKIQAWMGHASIATTMRYAHLRPQYDDQIELL